MGKSLGRSRCQKNFPRGEVPGGGGGCPEPRISPSSLISWYIVDTYIKTPYPIYEAPTPSHPKKRTRFAQGEKLAYLLRLWALGVDSSGQYSLNMSYNTIYMVRNNLLKRGTKGEMGATRGSANWAILGCTGPKNANQFDKQVILYPIILSYTIGI